jgi:hypothetical protein
LNVIEEQRNTQRRPLKVKALLAMEGRAPEQGRTLDISGNGVSVAVEHPAQPGMAGTVNFDLYYDGKSTPISARVKVAYCIFGGGEFKIGLTFVNLELAAMTVIAKYLK